MTTGSRGHLIPQLLTETLADRLRQPAASHRVNGQDRPIEIAFGGTADLFAIVLAIAAWTPARRAATTDPATALRAE